MWDPGSLVSVFLRGTYLSCVGARFSAPFFALFLLRLRCRRQNPVQPQINRLRRIVVGPTPAQRDQRASSRDRPVSEEHELLPKFRIVHLLQRRRAKCKRILHSGNQLVLRISLRHLHVRCRLPGDLRAERIVRLRDVHHQVSVRIHLRRRLKYILLRRHGFCRCHHVLPVSRHPCFHEPAHWIRHRPHVRLRRCHSAGRRRARRWSGLLRKGNSRSHQHSHHHKKTRMYTKHWILVWFLRRKNTPNLPSLK